MLVAAREGYSVAGTDDEVTFSLCRAASERRRWRSGVWRLVERSTRLSVRFVRLVSASATLLWEGWARQGGARRVGREDDWNRPGWTNSGLRGRPNTMRAASDTVLPKVRWSHSSKC